MAGSNKGRRSYLFVRLNFYDANASDAISAARKQQPHAVPWIQLPVLGGDIEQPPFGDKAIKKWE
jgi:hypothetical protein